MKKLMCSAVAVVAAVSCVVAEADTAVENSKPQKKVVIRISNCETPDSRLPEWKPPKAPAVLKKMPYSPEQIAAAPAEKVQKMVDDNAAVERDNFDVQMKIEYENWQANMEYMKGVRSKLTQTPFGQQVYSAIDKFDGVAANVFNPECIQFFDTLDMREGNDHAKFQTFKSAKVHVETYFLKLFFENPTKVERSITLGDGPITRTKWIQKVSASLKDGGGMVIPGCGGNFTEEMDSLDANADEAAEARVALIEKCLNAVAKKINDGLVATVVFKAASSVKGDEDFESVSPCLTIDGVQRGFDESIGLLKSDLHEIVAEADGYRTVRKTAKFSTSKTETIKFVPTTCKLTVNVKGPAGFDASSATIELVGADGASESLTSGEESTVQQGKWTLKVSADGYSAKPKALNLTSNKKVENITVVKEAAPAAGANAQ